MTASVSLVSAPSGTTINSSGYLEQGNFTVGDYKGVADAGVILCGNIRKEIMDADGYSNMFAELPVFLYKRK